MQYIEHYGMISLTRLFEHKQLESIYIFCFQGENYVQGFFGRG